MGILKNYEQLLYNMSRLSDDLHKLTKIIYAQQKQIHTLTNCVEQLQDMQLQIFDMKDE